MTVINLYFFQSNQCYHKIDTEMDVGPLVSEEKRGTTQ